LAWDQRGLRGDSADLLCWLPARDYVHIGDIPSNLAMVGLPYCVGPPGFPPQWDHLSKFHYSIVQAKRCEKAPGERNRNEVLGARVDLYMPPGNGHGGCWPFVTNAKEATGNGLKLSANGPPIVQGSVHREFHISGCRRFFWSGWVMSTNRTFAFFCGLKIF
jgi:hypothetical protein